MVQEAKDQQLLILGRQCNRRLEEAVVIEPQEASAASSEPCRFTSEVIPIGLRPQKLAQERHDHPGITRRKDRVIRACEAVQGRVEHKSVVGLQSVDDKLPSAHQLVADCRGSLGWSREVFAVNDNAVVATKRQQSLCASVERRSTGRSSDLIRLRSQ